MNMRTCSIPITKQRALFSRGRNAACCRVPRWRRCIAIATMSIPRCWNLLASLPEQHATEIRERVRLGIEHEIQHQELLLMDTRYNFSINPLQPAYHSVPVPASPVPVPQMGWQEFAGGIVEIGHDGNGFSYDNERPRHQTLLQDFRLGHAAGQQCGISGIHR